MVERGQTKWFLHFSGFTEPVTITKLRQLTGRTDVRITRDVARWERDDPEFRIQTDGRMILPESANEIVRRYMIQEDRR